jgi:hypothetical protein
MIYEFLIFVTKALLPPIEKVKYKKSLKVMPFF